MDLDLKGVLDGIKGSVEGFSGRLAAMQSQLDAVDSKTQHRHVGGEGTKSLAAEIFENAEFQALGEKGGRGRIAIKVENWRKKSLTSTSVGASTSGVLGIDRLPGIVPIPYQQLRIRDLLRSTPTSQSAVDYVRVRTFTNNASPQAGDGTAKSESDFELESVSAKVQTIAHWCAVSKQCFSDVAGLEETVNGHLLYGLKLKEETELLAGDGTTNHVYGLVPQSTAFDVTLLSASAGWTRLDVIARAIQQAERSNYAADVIVLHVDDFWGLALTKDGFGTYVLGDPGVTTIPRLWGRPIAITNTLNSGTFLVGSSATALIRDRLEAIIEISDSHADYFTRNLLAIRAEERIALQVTHPGAWIYGSFTTSPA
jgi:HK97 family phage major capsid protein